MSFHKIAPVKKNHKPLAPEKAAPAKKHGAPKKRPVGNKGC
ncbi:hypothetical protein [Streptomyces adelaidensis]|nr:hypothetical protein [Streptomyces adelaidensis]